MDALYCAFCLKVRKNDLNRAVTIINGQACCMDHMYYVQGGEYNRILAIIEGDEKSTPPPIVQEEQHILNKPKRRKSIFGV